MYRGCCPLPEVVSIQNDYTVLRFSVMISLSSSLFITHQDDLRKDARLMEFNSLVNKVCILYILTHAWYYMLFPFLYSVSAKTRRADNADSTSEHMYVQ